MAWEPLGWKAAWFSEIDPEHNYKSGPTSRPPCSRTTTRTCPTSGDMTRIHDNETFKKEEIDILVGGTPCQTFSLAGSGKGLDDERGKARAHVLRNR